MTDIFDTLGNVLESQFSLGENKLHSLDIVRNGHAVSYGRLGEFADKFDKSAERSYTEEGFYRTDLFNPRAKQLEIWMQEPDVTILVKKRAFSSLVENYKNDLLNKDERLFIRASKFLFQNKCKQIAAYEKLTKISTIATEIGAVDYHLLPVLFSTTDTLDSIFGGTSSYQSFKQVVDRVRTITNLSKDNVYTTWTTNVLNSFRTDLGEGTGVIEFTTAASINTTSSIHFGGGSCNITFVDPYELMLITHNDIEQAIADATSTIMGSAFTQLGLRELENGIQSDKTLLNKIRASRGANPINFIVNPDTFLGKRVRAIVDGTGQEIKFDGSLFKVDIDPAYIFPSGGLLDVNGLSNGKLPSGDLANAIDTIFDTSIAQPNTEVKIFESIVKRIFNQIQINTNSRKVSKKHNASTNTLRKKLRLHYGSKLIIQPMDSVHVFISSKTTVDNKILGGLQDSLNAVGFLQTANKALMNLQDFFHAGKDNSIEKALFVGKDFPNWLWLMMRNQITTDKSGTQVFAGLVENNSSNYDNNTFTVNISAKDNSSYFNFGVVNYKPALDVWNGSLFDPITPFNIEFDRATGFQKDQIPELLQENQDLFKSAFIKYKNGIYVGKKPTVNNFVQDTDTIQNASVRRIFYDPDGMVYKWKEGIGTLVMFGNNYEENPSTHTSTPPTTNDPFAGQDVMNVLSLMVTGEPYNFATFYKAASQFDSFGRDPHTGGDPSTSFFRNFQTDLKKRNLLYGNFVPFKKLVTDTETYKNVLNGTIRTESFERELNELLEQRADLIDRQTYLGPDNINARNLQPRINELNKKISVKKQKIADELKQINKPISLIGNDVSLDYSSDNLLDAGNKNNLSDADRLNRDLRRRIHYLTRRLSWKVRANEDINLFIVDDSYDKDYDIQEFEKSFTNPDLFRSEYTTVDEQIKRVSQLLDLEVFADTQGHIRVRVPQYNKIPSSVFYRMIRLKQEFDIQLYPQFLEDLYVTQLTNILDRLEIIEDEIRMYGLALGLNTDAKLEQYISTKGPNIPGNKVFTTFKFISDESTGATSRIILKDLSSTDNPDEVLQLFSNGLNANNSLSTQATVNNILSTYSRVDLLSQTTQAFIGKDVNSITSNEGDLNRKEKIADRLYQKSGQEFDLKQLFTNSNKLLGGKSVSQGDLLKVLNEISTRISERQRIIKIAAKALQNAQEGVSLIQNKGQIANKLITPGLLNNSQIPQGFEGIIEDESYDDYGPGSGKRYIIKPQHIKSMSITEHAPSFTSVEVSGKFGDNYINNLPDSLNGFTGPGNALTTALAVDYDLWRMYGVRIPQSINAPYLTDPQTQCAPFAVALLNKARKQIHDGSTINIFGNEYMQPGEVIYIEHLDNLFYVESVQHRINYGREFSTSLNVSYGHMPGQYIPTYLDTVGKILYKNKDITNFVNIRQDNVNNEQHIGTIIGSSDGTFTSPSDQISKGIYAQLNRQTLNDILQAADSAFSVAGANYQPTLELRIYYASSSGFSSFSPNAQALAEAIKQFLIGAQNGLSESFKLKQPSSFLKNQQDFINVVSIDSDDPEENRSPSSQAYNMARVTLDKKSTRNEANANKVDTVIYKYVVDCWINFTSD